MATYDAHATISQESLIPIDIWDWMSAAVRASLLVILLMLTLLFVTMLFASRSAHAQQVFGECTAILQNAEGTSIEFALEPLGTAPMRHMICNISGEIRVGFIAAAA